MFSSLNVHVKQIFLSITGTLVVTFSNIWTVWILKIIVWILWISLFMYSYYHCNCYSRNWFWRNHLMLMHLMVLTRTVLQNMKKNLILFDILVLWFSETLYKFLLYVICKVGSDFDGVGGKFLRDVNLTLTLLGRLKSGDEILGSLRATGHSLNNLEVQSPSFLYISAPRMILEGEVSDST